MKPLDINIHTHLPFIARKDAGTEIFFEIDKCCTSSEQCTVGKRHKYY